MTVVLSWITPVTFSFTPVLCALPVVLAIPFLSNRQLAVLAVMTMACGLVVSLLARAQRGAGLEAIVPKWIPDLLVFVFVPLSTALICLAAWQNQSGVLALADQLRRSRSRVMAATDRARLQLERDLHDGAQQRLVAAGSQLRTGVASWGAGPLRVREALTSATEILDRASRELRDLAHGLYPATLTEHGVVAALAAVTRLTDDRVTLRHEDVARYSQQVEAGVYFCCAQAIHDALKRGDAHTSVTVQVHGGRLLRFDVTDDGRGLGTDIDAGDGLTNMNDRVGSLGGTLTVHSQPGVSTTVTGIVPTTGLADDAGADEGLQADVDVAHLAMLHRLNLLVVLPALLFAMWAAASLDGRQPALAVGSLAVVTALWFALHLFRRGAAAAAAVVSVLTFQLFMLALVATVPSVLPYAPLALLGPVLISIPCVDQRTFRLIALSVVACSVIVVAIGRMATWPTLEDHLPKGLVDVAVAGSVPIALGLICLAAWRNQAGVLALAAQLRRSRSRVVAATDRARLELERDLHDGAQQHLVAAGLHLRTCVGLLDTNPARARQLLSSASLIVDQAGEELRDLANGVYPAALTDHGVVAALQAIARHTDDRVTVRSDVVPRYPQQLEAGVYFCCAQAIHNALKHGADDTTVEVRLSGGSALRFDVTDTGPGFNMDTNNGQGLINMNDRMGALGGTLTIHSRPGTSTTVTGIIPLAAP